MRLKRASPEKRTQKKSLQCPFHSSDKRKRDTVRKGAQTKNLAAFH